MNLKEFVDLLEANGKLKRVTKEVDPVYEVAEIGRASCRERV